MIKVSIMYPNNSEAFFDLDYYKSKHIPLIKKLLRSAALAVTLDKGISGLPGHPPIYSVVCDIYSESTEIFFKAFNLHFAELDADVINFTKQKSIVQISEVLILKT